MKVHFIKPKDPISTIEFLSTFKLTCGTNHIRKEAAVRVLPHITRKKLSHALKSHVYAKNILTPYVAPLRIQKRRRLKLLGS